MFRALDAVGWNYLFRFYASEFRVWEVPGAKVGESPVRGPVVPDVMSSVAAVPTPPKPTHPLVIPSPLEALPEHDTSEVRFSTL